MCVLLHEFFLHFMSSMIVSIASNFPALYISDILWFFNLIINNTISMRDCWLVVNLCGVCSLRYVIQTNNFNRTCIQQLPLCDPLSGHDLHWEVITLYDPVAQTLWVYALYCCVLLSATNYNHRKLRWMTSSAVMYDSP